MMPQLTSQVRAAEVLIRPAGPADLDAIMRVQEASILHLGVARYGRTKARAWARAGVRYGGSLFKEGLFFVAERDGAVVGVSGWSPDLERHDEAWVRYVFVAPEAARIGLGRRLVASAEASALTTGRERFRLWSSLNALGFYRRLGYRELRHAIWPVEPGIELEYVLMSKKASR